MENNVYLPENVKFFLSALKTHYGQCYVQVARLSLNINALGEFGTTDCGFFTHYDGGFGQDWELETVWHFFGKVQEGGEYISWICVVNLGEEGETQNEFQMTLPTENKNWWPSVTEEELLSLLFQNLRNAAYCKKLTKNQLREASKMQKNTLSSWGQGNSRLFA